jgi:hypothetical protein
MERRLYDNSQFRHNTTDGHHGVVQSTRFKRSRLLTTLLAFLRTEIGGNHGGGNKKVLLVKSRMRAQFSQSFLLQNTPYALFFLPSSLALFLYHSGFRFCFAWSVGLRRAPFFERARPRRLAMRWKGYMGQFRSGGNYTLASLS